MSDPRFGGCFCPNRYEGEHLGTCPQMRACEYCKAWAHKSGMLFQATGVWICKDAAGCRARRGLG